jgi:hypothetical protein
VSCPCPCLCTPPETQSLVLVAAGFAGENALARYDQTAYTTIESQSQHGVSSFTYLRLNPTLMESYNFNTFANFVAAMKGVCRNQECA